MLHAILAALALVAAPDPAVPQAPPDNRDRGPNQLDVSDYPAEHQARYPLFAVKCSRCHSLARPINTRFDQRQWAIYSKKMARRPNSAINDAQLDELYAFLKYYSTRAP